MIRGGYGIAYDFNFLNPITNQRFLPPFVSGSAEGRLFTGTNRLASIVAGSAGPQKETRARPASEYHGCQLRGCESGDCSEPAQSAGAAVQRGRSAGVPGLVGKAGYVGSKGNYLQRTRFMNLIPHRVTPAASLADETARLAEFLAANSGLTGGAAEILLPDRPAL